MEYTVCTPSATWATFTDREDAEAYRDEKNHVAEQNGFTPNFKVVETKA